VFRTLRIFILLVILLNAALGTWLTHVRTTSWETPLRIMVYPINADGSPGTARYIARLQRESFRPVEDFFREEAQRYGMTQTDVVDFYLGSEVTALPPTAPHGGNVAQIMLWSLSMRLWAWRHAEHPGQPDPHVRMFVLYYDPANVQRVAHSLGLQKGLIGVVHAFASEGQTAQNAVVLAHELLHTVGAKDKYDPENNQPQFPDGYAEPEKTPPLPQRFAEIMAGRIAKSERDAQMPSGLHQVLIGSKTAQEINWIQR